ncbi:histone H3 Lys 36 methyltransferase/ASH1 [Volvox carteri f. nagariensis]|uniref:Histone H3 Lys 36 methyltransferase/ASH1 n=1 Tax=Volvox carteri f. nagariensis TaxID=3068 RepID=D8TY38_VOLCA|nr:histone H3 Lys 36 methyltransferase/ASH1 [Volvox carteri f. nagariensis]EFJ47578.1 histone H3 Lys 36 methyltransferase/ASH1 [Volvox carteri f. nagariensis]|eukprot:XP_002951402.1 histone H3 Lys 36 methyltransferase/ASH1 [Volvox carteri f. nagariensis]
MANEGVLAALEKEFRPLLAPKLLAEAKAAQVVWARVKGYPAWPAQVLTEAAALRRKDLGQERHSKGNSVPVMFFGTVEVAWVKDADVVDFKEGLYQGFFDRKTKHFRLALEQVCEYLALDRKRKAPPKWWCKPPSNGLDEQSDGPSPKLVSASGNGAAKGAGQRQDASKSSRQRAIAPESGSGTSSGEDEAHAAHASGRKGSAKPAGGKEAAGGKPVKEAAATGLPAKLRDTSAGRVPRENGSTAASTNTAAQAQAKKPPTAPQAAASRQQVLVKESNPAGDAAREVKDTRQGASAANSEGRAPPPPPQQRLRSSAGASSASVKAGDAGLPPRKRVKVEAGAGAVVGPTAASASSLPPPPVVAAKRTASVGDDACELGAVCTNEVDVLKLPAEIRRLAGIRLPALPKKPGARVEESSREQPLPKTEHAAALNVANGPATASKRASAVGENAGMELRSTRPKRTSSAAGANQPAGGRSTEAGQKKRSRGRSSSGESSQSAASSDGQEEEEDKEGQSSGEEDDTDAAACSSSSGSSSDEESSASEEVSDDDTAIAAARRSGRGGVAQSHRKALRSKSLSQPPPARDRRGEKQRRLARLAAPEPANRRTSSRLARKPPEAAPSKKAINEDSDTADSGDPSDEASDSDSDEGGGGEDERSSSEAANSSSSSSGESDSDDEVTAKESGGSGDVGIKQRLRTRAVQAAHVRPQRAPALQKASAGPSSQPPIREASQPADQLAKASTGRADRHVDTPDDDKGAQRRQGSGSVLAPPPRAIPLELRRLQTSPSSGIQAVDTNEPRTLRDRSSPAQRTLASTGVTPTQTATAGASAGFKRGEERVSEDGSGTSMSRVVERSMSPEHRRDGQKTSSEAEAKMPPRPARSQVVDGRSSKAGSVAGSASPPPAPMPGVVPVRKKPASLGVPSTARSAGQVGARQLPAITPAKAVLRSLTSMGDGLPSSTMHASGCGGTSAAGALIMPIAVCVPKKPSTGPPTRRLVEPSLEASAFSTGMPDVVSVDCDADAKHASSPDIAAAGAVDAGDGYLPRSPDVSAKVSGMRMLEEGLAGDRQGVAMDEQQQVELLVHLQLGPAEHCAEHDRGQAMPLADERASSADAEHGFEHGTVPGAEATEATKDLAKQMQRQAPEQCEAPEAAVRCIQPRLELDVNLAAKLEQQDQVDHQPSSCCQQTLTNTLTDPVEQAAALTSRSSVVHDQENEPVNRSPARALSAPAQLQQVAAVQAASALGPQVRSSPGSPIHDEVLLSDEQLPDQGEAMAEHDGYALPPEERLTLGSSGGIRGSACLRQVAVADSEAAREAPTMASPSLAAPFPPLEGHGAVSAPPACAGSRASSEAGCGDGAPAGVSGASCSATLWGGDDDAAARARAMELEELGEVAAALADLQQAEVPRPAAELRPASHPAASQLPAALQADSLLIDRSRSRGSRGLPHSSGSQGNLVASESLVSEVFRWPQPEPLLPAQDQSFALPRDWLVTRPPRYEPIRRNVWLSRNKPKRLPKDEINICACRPPPFAAPGELQRMGCAQNCLNRLSSVLCDAKLCPCGELCSNRSLHLLRQPKTEVFLTENRGWGVRTMEPLSKGAFIIEYAGEVIDDRELGRRMEHARMNGEPHFYIMELAAGLYIDARRKGNIARLINSSCDPNCETQKWHDASTGEIRVGIFASRDIPPGEELVYDYFFSTYGAIKQSAASFVCMCGSKNCRGTMDLHPEKRRDLGRRVEVFWDADGQYYRAVIVAYHPTSKKHTVMYEDGGTEKLSLDEVPHRWMDDDQPRTSAQQPELPHGGPSGDAQTVVADPPQSQPQPQQRLGMQTPEVELPQQRLQEVSAVDDELADVLPGGRSVPIAAVPSQVPPRPLIPIDQRCLLPPLGSTSVEVVGIQSHGQVGKHRQPGSELHLPLKKRPRMVQHLTLSAHQYAGLQPSPLSNTLGTSIRAGETVQEATQPQTSGGSAGAVVLPVSGHNRYSIGGADSADGEPNGLSARTSARRESSVTASGRISSVAADEDDLNEDLDSLLEAAEAVAALRTAPISNPAALHAQHEAMLPLQPRRVRSGSLAAAGLGTVAMVLTAKAASPRHLAAVQRSGPPNGLPPHGGSRPSATTAPHPSSSSSGFIPHQAGGCRQHPAGNGSGHHTSDGGVGGLYESYQHQSHGRNRRLSGEHDGGTGPASWNRGKNGNGSHCSGDVNREGLLWKLVGIEKPKDLLPLFSGECEKSRNGGVKGRAASSAWIPPTHPYDKLLRALEASELLPHADQLRLFAHQHSQQQQLQQHQQPQHQQLQQHQQPPQQIQSPPPQQQQQRVHQQQQPQISYGQQGIAGIGAWLLLLTIQKLRSRRQLA